MNNLRGKINSALLCTGTYAGNLAFWNSLALNSELENVAAYATVGFLGSSYYLTKKFLVPSVDWLCNKKPGSQRNIGTTILAGLSTLTIMNMSGVGCEQEAHANMSPKHSIIEKSPTIRDDSLENLINIRKNYQQQEKNDTIIELPEIKINEPKISPEYRALLDTISWAEGNTDYDTLYGGGKFNDFSNHPNQKIRRWGLTSSAAGKYQFTYTTFKHLHDKKDLFQEGFTPEAQDEAALYLVEKKGVNERLLNAAIKTGNFNRVWDKLSRTWASLPTKEGGSFYGQGSKSKRKLRKKFMEFYQH